MAQNKIFSYVGFAIKAGKVKYGVDNIICAKKAPAVILISSDLSDNSLKQLEKYMTAHASEHFIVDLKAILPGKNCKALGITDTNLADAIKSEIKESMI